MTSPTTSSPHAAVEQNVDAIVALALAEEQSVTRHQRAIEKMVSVLALPAFLFCMLGLTVAWVGLNVGLGALGKAPLDPPPFGWLQSGISVVALVITSVVVITQHRQGKLAARNAQLDLHVNLLVDQKVTKIIQLLEELRTDSPHLKDRKDEVAEELQIAHDPALVVSRLAEKLTDMMVGDLAQAGPSSENESIARTQ